MLGKDVGKSEADTGGGGGGGGGGGCLGLLPPFI